jgi:hypothetical protein
MRLGRQPLMLCSNCLFSAFRNRRSEDVPVHAIVTAELELSNIQGHIFLADFVECADHAALKDGPKAFDGLGMNRADDIEAFGVVDDGVRIFLAKAVVALPLIGAEQAHLCKVN